MVDAYIGLGSNLDGPSNHVTTALAELAQLPKTLFQQASSLYQTAPVGPTDQPDFINAVCQVKTELQPLDLLQQLQQLENAHQRVRAGERWGPRTLDLDLLLYGDQVIDLPDLQVPHRQLQARCFVLQPLSELNADLHVPGLGAIKELLANVDCNDVRKLQHAQA